MRVYLETYGCTLNQADSDIIRGILKGAGHRIVTEREAEIVIINSCTVKGATENKIISRIREIKKPLIIAGCLVVNEKRIREERKDAVLVWPGALNCLEQAVRDAKKGIANTYKSNEYKDSLPKEFTKPILRIAAQEGCCGNCYFCQTKLARPELRSYNPERIVQLIEEGIKKGAKEIQLTGMDLGAYGLDLIEASASKAPAFVNSRRDRKTNLIELLKRIEKIKGEFIVRLGMINPQHAKRMLPELVKTLKGKKFYKFLHAPVQTGSEKVCKEMNRGHTVKDFVDIVKNIRRAIPSITIATDIIVGYPTETKEDFEQTIQLIEKIKPDIVNVSKFTSRAGTKASKMKQLKTQEIKERSRRMSEVCKRIAKEKNEKFIGKVLEILITEKGRDFTGRTENYKQVVVKNLNQSTWPSRSDQSPSLRKGRTRAAERQELSYNALGEKIKRKIKEANHGSLIG